MNCYRGEDWEFQKQKALDRDECCVRCASKLNLAVHHIVPWSKSKENELRNLVTLCPACHMKEENFYRQHRTPSLFIKRLMQRMYPNTDLPYIKKWT